MKAFQNFKMGFQVLIIFDIIILYIIFYIIIVYITLKLLLKIVNGEHKNSK